jgi:hypothetical protein
MMVAGWFVTARRPAGTAKIAAAQRTRRKPIGLRNAAANFQHQAPFEAAFRIRRELGDACE